MQNSIIDKAKKLGLDTGSGDLDDNLRTIASQVGLHDFNSETDLETLNGILDEKLNIDDRLNEVEDINIGEDAQNAPIRDDAFGQKEYDRAKKNGVYNADHYKNRQQDLDKKADELNKERQKNWKMKKGETGPVKADGSNTVRKSKMDMVMDNLKYANAKKNAITNKIDDAKAKAYNATHPGEAIKDKAEAKVKDVAKEGGKKAASAVGKAGKKAASKTAQVTAKAGAKLVAFIAANPWVLLVILIVFIFFLILVAALSSSSFGNNNYMGLNGYDYIDLKNKCEKIYVHGTPNNEDGTYSLEDYVAGVVNAEVGGFNNETMYEVASITARTFALNRLQNSSDCSILGNETAQVFKKNSNELINKAVDNTRGLVLTKDGVMISTQYDAFCWDRKDDTNYYLCQKELAVPIEWANIYVKKFTGQAFLDNKRYRSHGNGMSQDGAYYLATEKNKRSSEILSFFYGSDTKLLSIYRTNTINGTYALNPNDEKYQNLQFIKDKTFGEILASQGLSIEQYNSALQNVVQNAGVGTRGAAVNVAVHLIGSLADMGYKLPYQWGGKGYGSAYASWGTPSNMSSICRSYSSIYGNTNKCLNEYKWQSFDCSGFVNWVLSVAFQFNSLGELQSAGLFQTTDKYQSKALNANKAVCEPGDVLVNEGHIVIVVGLDDNQKKYIVAESTGSDLVTKTGGVKLSYYNYGSKSYVCRSLASKYKG